MTQAAKGRESRRPTAVARLDRREILREVRRAIFAHDVGLRASGAAFFGVLAVFPAIAAVVAAAAAFTDPALVEADLTRSGVLPEAGTAIIRDLARQALSGESGGDLFVVIFGLGGVLIAASRAVKMLMHGVTVAHEVEETRGFYALNLTALALILVTLTGGVAAFACVVAAPALIEELRLRGAVAAGVAWGRWPALAAVAMLGLAVLYRYGASRERPGWRWTSPGAVAATLLWIAVSVLFSVYVNNFGRFGATYGVLGGVMILMLWMWLSAFVVLLGAELNAAIERRKAAPGR